MFVYVVEKSGDVVAVTETLDRAMELVDQERYRVEGPSRPEHAWVLMTTSQGKGRSPQLSWLALVNGNKEAIEYAIARWYVLGTR